METSALQVRLTTMLVLIACIAVNIWLFRLGVFWGILGLNVSKHVVIAQLCHAVGLNRNPDKGGSSPSVLRPPSVGRPEPSSN